jgi:2-keto-4-pentenoate hydratase/2-oxohepta-3-ene-1,7-dioic acid hydratase in catechol pathway
MKLVTFRTNTGQPRLGLAIDDQICDLSRRLPDAPGDMIALIIEWAQYIEPLQCIQAAGEADYRMVEVELLAPVPRPGKIFGTGLNYLDHIAESGLQKPVQQIWFSKAVTAVNGPYQPVQRPRVSSELDYEAELAFIIGRRCRHVPAERAHEVIFGYAAANDFSVRDWQLRTSQFLIGKSFDTHGPFGPWIVTSDEIPDPHALGIRCFVNGEIRQDSNTRELLFNCYQQVEHLSMAMTLEPGDVILTGTPGGVGFGYKPPRYLRPGDVVRVEIDAIGAIENRVVDEPVPQLDAPDGSNY